MNKVLFSIAFFIAYTIQGVTGFAGNIFAMPAGTHLLGLTGSVAVLNAMGVFACGLLALMNLKSVVWRELGKIVGVMLPFLLFGIWLDTVISLDVLLRVYGLVVLFVGAYNLLSPRQRFLPTWLQYVILALAGIIQGMFVSGGAFLVIYAVQNLTDKQQFRATLSMVWTILNLLYALIAFQAGYFTVDVGQTALLCVPFAVAATVLGNRLQKRISQERFLKIAYVLLLIIGLILLVTA